MDKSKRYRTKQVEVKVEVLSDCYKVVYLDGSVTFLTESDFYKYHEEISEETPENEVKPVEKKVRYEALIFDHVYEMQNFVCDPTKKKYKPLSIVSHDSDLIVLFEVTE